MEKKIKITEKIIEDSVAVLKNVDTNISKSYDILKKYAVDINSITAAGIIGFDPNLMLETKVKMTENTESHSWEELVAEAEKNGFIDSDRRCTHFRRN